MIASLATKQRIPSHLEVLRDFCQSKSFFSASRTFISVISYTIQRNLYYFFFTYTQLPNLTVYRAGQSTQLSVGVRVFLFCFRHDLYCCHVCRKKSGVGRRDLRRDILTWDFESPGLRLVAVIVVSPLRRPTSRFHYGRATFPSIRKKEKKPHSLTLSLSLGKEIDIYSRRDESVGNLCSGNRTNIYRLRALWRSLLVSNKKKKRDSKDVERLAVVTDFTITFCLLGRIKSKATSSRDQDGFKIVVSPVKWNVEDAGSSDRAREIPRQSHGWTLFENVILAANE